MAQNDIFSGLSVDGILSDVQAQQGEKMRIWSMDEIDKLLSETEADAVAPVTQTASAPHTVVSNADTAEIAQTELPQETPQIESARGTETPRKAGGLKAAAKRAAQVEYAEETSESAQTESATDRMASVTADSAAQPEPLLEGAQPQMQEETVAQRSETISETPLPGQISIEKTRVFNEVEARAVHSADIEHHIGQPILRTTTGEFDPVPPRKASAMETDAQRERFLHRPEQQLEKTMEHKELLAKLPPKTIERPGVIVRKAPGQVTGTDGLQAIPTLVTPEDVLKAQQEAQTRVQAGTLKRAAYAPAESEEAPLDDQMVFEDFLHNGADEATYIDETEAELSLIERRREKAKKFRLFPGLNTEETQADGEAESAEERSGADTAEAEHNLEKTRVQPDFDGDFPPAESGAEEAAEVTDEAAEGVDRKARRTAQQHETPITVLREFYGPKDAQAVYDIFLAEQRGCNIRLIVFAVLTAAAAISSFAVRLTGDFGLFNGSASVYSAVHLVFLVMAALLSLQELKAAFLGLFRRRIDAVTGLPVALFFACIQVGLSYAFPERLTAVPLYTAVALLVFTLYFAGRKRKLKNDICNYETVAKNYNRFYEIGKIQNPDTAFEIGRGLLLGDPDVRYAKRISFPSHFVEISKRNDAVLNVHALALPVVLIAAGVIGAITCFTAGDVFVGVSAMCAVAVSALPMSATLVSAATLRNTNRRLLREGAMAASYDAAVDVTAANAVVLDAAELFDAANCRLRGMKMYHKMRVDEALLYTAAMTIQSGGTLSAVFDGVILHKCEMLPQVESLRYEERLGCSGWIYNQRVLVGNRDLLQKHNVDAPTR